MAHAYRHIKPDSVLRVFAEHSLELHTPYIAKIMAGRPFTLVPIMVGALSTEGCAAPGRAAPRGAPRLRPTRRVRRRRRVVCACHRGGRPPAFTAYLAAYRNTICGRHPIAVLLQMVSASARRFSIEFNCYDQSSKATAPGDSSVSYASAVVTAL
ncbi:memo1 [Scenedesmus sp. PABB004]|nr:memo1 [Scenedesmus sp. PABB004]